MTTIEGYPKIQIEYIVKKENADTVPYLFAAGLSYMAEREVEEEATVEARASAEITSVKYGRNVLERMSYAEIVRQAELMREDIESSDALVENNIDASKSFAGHRLLGNLPDSE